MLGTRSTPKPREGALLWLFKIAAGVLIVVLLGLHFLVNHLLAPEGLLSYEEVIAYYQNPIIPAVEILFLIVVIAHALVGLRSIILDLDPSDRLLRILDVLFWIAGAGFSAYGIWLALTIVRLGA